MIVDFLYTVEDLLEAQSVRTPGSGWRHALPAMLGRNAEADQAVVLALRGLAVLTFALILLVTAATYLCLRVGGIWILIDVVVLIFALAALSMIVLGTANSGEWGIRRQLKSVPGLEDPLKLRLDEAGVDVEASAWRIHVDWQSVRRLHETKSLFLLVDDAPSTILVPKRALPDQQAFRTYVQSMAPHLRISVSPEVG